MSSPPAAPVAGGAVTSAGDFTSQSRLDGGAGSHFDPARSTLISRSMFVEEYRNPDGTQSVRQSNQPLNVQDAAGAWLPVRTDLATDAATKRAGVEDHPLSPSLAAKANDAAVLEVESGGHTASLAFDQAAPATAAVSDDSVSYHARIRSDRSPGPYRLITP